MRFRSSEATECSDFCSLGTSSRNERARDATEFQSPVSGLRHADNRESNILAEHCLETREKLVITACFLTMEVVT